MVIYLNLVNDYFSYCSVQLLDLLDFNDENLYWSNQKENFNIL